jgi:hypothetical protein
MCSNELEESVQRVFGRCHFVGLASDLSKFLSKRSRTGQILMWEFKTRPCNLRRHRLK